MVRRCMRRRRVLLISVLGVFVAYWSAVVFVGGFCFFWGVFVYFWFVVLGVCGVG